MPSIIRIISVGNILPRMISFTHIIYNPTGYHEIIFMEVSIITSFSIFKNKIKLF